MISKNKVAAFLAKHPKASKIVMTGTAMAATAGSAVAAVDTNFSDGVTEGGKLLAIGIAQLSTPPLVYILGSVLVIYAAVRVYKSVIESL